MLSNACMYNITILFSQSYFNLVEKKLVRKSHVEIKYVIYNTIYSVNIINKY